MKAKQVNNDISDLIKGWDISFGKAVRPFIDWLLEQLKKLAGRTIKQVVDQGWKLFDVGSKIKDASVKSVVDAVELKVKSIDPDAIINTKGVKADLTNKPWTSDGVNMNRRMGTADTRTRRYITNSIKLDFEKASNYDDNLKKINNHIRQRGSVDETFLRKRVRRMTQDIRSIGFEKDYEKELKLLEKEIKTLAEMNYPTSETKKAYEGFIKAVRGKNVEAVEKSIDNMVRTKARYISRRVARTETARSQLDAFLLMSADDEDVIGYRWRLSDQHRVVDQCDYFSKADFGLGAGVYKKDRLPPIPAHSQCACFLTEVIIDDENPKNLNDFGYYKNLDKELNKFSAKDQDAILGGKARGEAFRSGSSFESEMGSPYKTEDLKTRLEKRVESKFIN
jgi:hypothetical protein